MIYGWRARIGLILPADNVVMEPELYGLGLDGVSFHGLRLTTTDHDEMRRQAVSLGGAVRELGLDAVAYACAETSFNVGSGERQTLSDSIRQEAGVPFVTATQALLAAIDATGARTTAIFTPYRSQSGSDLEATLTGAGVEVVSAVHRDFRDYSTDPREWFATNRESSEDVYRRARAVDSADADALTIVSTNLNTIAIIRALEADLRKPVITSNQAIVWWVTQTLGLDVGEAAIGSLASRRLSAAKVAR